MLKGGVIMDVVTPDQAKIAEDAGACAVMALERVPADIRVDGGVARMSSPKSKPSSTAGEFPKCGGSRKNIQLSTLVKVRRPTIVFSLLWS